MDGPLFEAPIAIIIRHQGSPVPIGHLYKASGTPGPPMTPLKSSSYDTIKTVFFLLRIPIASAPRYDTL